MKTEIKCGFCEWTFNGHGNAHFSAMRDHYRAHHPEELKDLRAQTESIRNQIKALKEKYSHAVLI